MNFDEIFDRTAGVYFYFYNICTSPKTFLSDVKVQYYLPIHFQFVLGFDS